MRGVPAKGADGGVPRGLELNSRFGARGLFRSSGGENVPEPRVIINDFEEAIVVRRIVMIFFVGVVDKAAAKVIKPIRP